MIQGPKRTHWVPGPSQQTARRQMCQLRPGHGMHKKICPLAQPQCSCAVRARWGGRILRPGPFSLCEWPEGETPGVPPSEVQPAHSCLTPVLVTFRWVAGQQEGLCPCFCPLWRCPGLGLRCDTAEYHTETPGPGHTASNPSETVLLRHQDVLQCRCFSKQG